MHLIAELDSVHVKFDVQTGPYSLISSCMSFPFNDELNYICLE